MPGHLVKRPQRLRNKVQKIGRTQSWVMINGPTGSGKGVTAHALHQASTRNNKPFVEISLAAIPPQNIARRLFGSDELAKGQMPIEEALRMLTPMLKDPSILKIGQNMKYDAKIFAQIGITVAPFDDTMLLSYVLDAGRGKHGMDTLSETHLGHTPIPFKEVAGSGKSKISFAQVEIDKATAFRNLNDMTDAGLLRRTELGDHVWRFEAIDPNGHNEAAHPHFLCVDCGSVTCLGDVELTTPSQRQSELVGKVTEILIRGHCNDCR